MKLSELLLEVFENGPVIKEVKLDATTLQFDDYRLGPAELKELKPRLLECDEFKDVDELIILDSPSLEHQSGIMPTVTRKMGDDVTFKKRVFLYSISLTPEIYSPEDLNKPVKDNAYISHTVYNALDMTPNKFICLGYSPEGLQDDVFMKRMQLHTLLDKILDNPQDYIPTPKRGIMLRGICEHVVGKDGGEGQVNLEGMEFNFGEPQFGMIYYTNRGPVTEGEDGIPNLAIEIKNKVIPMALAEKYKEEFGDRGVRVTEEEINDFLERNQ